MASITVGTSAVEIPGASGALIEIQNQSAGEIELLETAGGAVGDGLVIAAEATYQPVRPFPGRRWLIAGAPGADVRLLAG